MVKHKNWKDYTAKDIRKIVEEKCQKVFPQLPVIT